MSRKIGGEQTNGSPSRANRSGDEQGHSQDTSSKEIELFGGIFDEGFVGQKSEGAVD